MRFSKLAAGLTAIAAALVLSAALAGCGGSPDSIYAQAIGFQCPNHDSVAARAVCVNNAPGNDTETVSRYCYRTLADANCFDRPDHDRQNQELGSSGY